MTGSADPSHGPVRPAVALAFALVGFIALLIAGLGITTLVLDADLIAAGGLGELPGVTGVLVAAAAFAGLLWAAVRRAAAAFWGALWITAGTLLGYLVGIAVGAGIAGADPAVAVAAAGRVATSWFGVVVAGSALVSAWAGIALVRTRAARPRWPWERDEE